MNLKNHFHFFEVFLDLTNTFAIELKLSSSVLSPPHDDGKEHGQGGPQGQLWERERQESDCVFPKPFDNHCNSKRLAWIFQ